MEQSSNNKYSVERFQQVERRVDKKFYPYVLDCNPFPDVVSLGIADFPIGRVIPGFTDNIPFSEELRRNEIEALNKKLEDFTYSREPNLLWICGKRGVGKTTLLQYFFKKPLTSSALKERSLSWYVTYDKHEDVKFLNNPFKYLLEQLNKNLKLENVESFIYHDLLTGAIYTFLIHEKFELYKAYLANNFSDEDFHELRKGIENKGASYLKELLENSGEDVIANLVKLIQTLREVQILRVDKDYLDKFITPFIENRLKSTFLTEDRTLSYLNPRVKAEQESILINTVRFITSGAFKHFILILDQLDVAWNNSKTAYRRKENFFEQLTSLIRQLNDSGFILILAVMDETEQELKQYIHKNQEAKRIASNEKNYLFIPEIQSKEEVAALLKEYLNRNSLRTESAETLDVKTRKYGTPDGLFPFDITACDELLKFASKGKAKTTNNILSLAYQCIDIAADKLEESKDEDSSPHKVITAKVIAEILS